MEKEIREQMWRRMTEKYSGFDNATTDILNWMNRTLKSDKDSLENEAISITIIETAKFIFNKLDKLGISGMGDDNEFVKYKALKEEMINKKVI